MGADFNNISHSFLSHVYIFILSHEKKIFVDTKTNLYLYMDVFSVLDCSKQSIIMRTKEELELFQSVCYLTVGTLC